MNYKEIITQLYQELKSINHSGEKASYIPYLEKVEDTKFGIHISATNGESFGIGDYKEAFSIQSISKVLTLTLAYMIEDKALWKRVGVEPSGTSFNSMILLELEKGIPRNPFINAGAIVVCDVLLSHYEHPEYSYIEFIRRIAGNDTINYSEEIAQSEKEVAYRNYSLIHMMKSFGNIHNDVDRVMDFYFKICSIKMNCEELSKAFLFFANCGENPHNIDSVLDHRKTKRINAIMQLCGFYDEAGEFAYRVGLPGKSGVGGGIIAVHPAKYTIAVWSPKLNKKGNSAKGMAFLEEFTTKLNSSIF